MFKIDTENIKRSEKFFVLYKGDDVESSGTLAEISQKTGRKLVTLNWMLSPAAKKRRSHEAKYKGRLELVEG